MDAPLQIYFFDEFWQALNVAIFCTHIFYTFMLLTQRKKNAIIKPYDVHFMTREFV